MAEAIMAAAKNEALKSEIRAHKEPVKGILQTLCIRIATSKQFDNFIILLILLNCASLAAYDPIQEGGAWNETLSLIELAFNACFTVEIIIRVTSLGSLLQHLRDAWNFFDFVIVVMGYSSLLGTSSGVNGLRALRALRALRPLRTVSRVPSLRAIADSFVNAVPLLLSVMSILFFYHVLFAIAGLNLFMKALHNRCVDSSGVPNDDDSFGCGGAHTCTAEGSFCGDEDDLADGHGILPPGIPAFDNFLKSILTVFVGTTLEGWPTMMYRTMDSTSTASILYYFGLVLSGPFFIVNLFLAVLKIKFSESAGMEEEKTDTEPKDVEGEIGIQALTSPASQNVSTTDEQPKLCLRSRLCQPFVWLRKLLSSWCGERSGPRPKYLQLCLRLVESNAFNRFFWGVILVNTLCLAVEYHGMPESMQNFLSVMNVYLTMLFTLELVLKIAGLGLSTFLEDYFNIFDFLIVAISMVEINVEGGIKGLSALRCFRVLRIFKVFKYAPSLTQIVGVLLSSLASFLSIGLLLFLFLGVFSIIGLHVYGDVLEEDQRPNFRNIGQAFILVFQVLTLENWNELMLDVVDRTDWSAVLYFVLWVIIGNYICLTLFLAVVMEAFEGEIDSNDTFSKKKTAPSDAWSVKVKTSMRQMTRKVSTIGRVASRMSKVYDKVAEQKIVKTSSGYLIVPLSPDPMKFQISDSEAIHMDEISMHHVLSRGRQPVPQPEGTPPGAVPEEPPFLEMARTPPSDAVDLGLLTQTPDSLEPLADLQSELALGLDASLQSEGDALEEAAKLAPLSPPDSPSPRSQSPRTSRSRLPSSLASLALPDDEHAPGPEGKSLAQPVGESAHGAPRIVDLRTCSGLEGLSHLHRDSDMDLEMLPEELEGRRELEALGLPGTPGRCARVDQPGGPVASSAAEALDGPGALGRKVSLPEGRPPGAATGPQAVCEAFDPQIQVVEADIQAHDRESILRSPSMLRSDSNPMHPDKLAEEVKPRMAMFNTANDEHPAVRLMRAQLLSMVNSRSFDYFMFVCVILSYGLERPTMEDDSKEGKIWTLVDLVTMSIFTLEMVLKVAIFGLWKDNARQKAYLSSSWNRLDMTIVFSSLLLFGLEQGTSIPELGLVRLLRALRPLRIISRSAGIQLVVNSLMHSVFSITNVFLLCVLFFFIFGILGVQLFAGKFHKCQIGGEPTDMGYEDFGTTSFSQLEKVVAALDRDECTCSYCSWENAFLHFDNIGIAMLSLFVVSALDGWAEVLHDAMDATEVDKAPKRDNFPGAFMFLAVFICIVAFALLNLFIGVVHFQFSRIKMLKQTNDVILTEDQKHWTLIVYTLSRLSAPVLVEAPSGTGLVAKSRQYVFRMVVHPMFDNLMMLCILLNTLSMACTHYRESAVWTQILNYGNYFFVTIFTAEAGCKIIGLGPKQYWKDGWNRFDFVIVMGSLLDLMVAVLNASFLRIFRVGRISRISRVMRLTRSLNGVQSLMKTLVQSLSAFQTVGSLLLLVFFMYSYAGVLLFGRIKHGDNINDHANFESFDFASITLLRVATGEAWAGILEDSWKNGCKDGDSNNKGCGGIVAIPFYLSFLLAVSMILLQLFTAIIIQNFEDRDSKDRWPITEEMMESFSQLWEENAQGEYLSVKGLRRMMDTMPEPIGLISEKHYLDHPPIGVSHGANVLHLVSNVDVKLSPYGMRFHSTLYALCTRVAEQELPYGDLRRGHQAMVANMKSSTGPYIAKSKDPQDDSDLSYFRTFSEAEQRQIGLVHVMAALVVQAYWRRNVEKIRRQRKLRAEVAEKERQRAAEEAEANPVGASHVQKGPLMILKTEARVMSRKL
ncbi:mitochondrial thiamine pyrophosphate transporter [Cymbomonas tetramitiformis]|uniref:Mitochondrial thiamine pyrophosphate transporter n=1 Tax=Cymbomonas tetramitiformis TaxID=36881 RepID=A0AAE0BE05_9CHLO|nr:mitochondrial thiamine pyrophosphate transporter [Cymbomonas tetramitiformis]